LEQLGLDQPKNHSPETNKGVRMTKAPKVPFDMPKLIGLDGREVTEDRLIEELTADRLCLGGGHNCSSGGKVPAVEEEIV
jgi:hypothetical protein